MKLHKFNSEELVCYYKSTKPVDLPNYEYNEKYVRGVWISNVVNIDTPIMQDVESYKEYLVKMIENIASYNINLMIFQVRPLNDAYYESKLNPWSRFITGCEGKNPGFDVLKFVIEEAKKYNIEVHAWMNPYRVSMKSVTDGTTTKEEYLNSLDDMNFAKRYPEDTILDGNGKIILKPSSERVIKFVTDSIMEVIENYDVTGVHIDDYFYPYAKVPESEEIADYEASGKEKSFDDWRNFADDRKNYTPLCYVDEKGEPWDKTYKHPGGETDLAVNVFVEYIEGEFELVSTAKELKNARTKNIYLLNDIDFDGDEMCLEDTIADSKDEIGLLSNVLTLRMSLKQLNEKELDILNKRYYLDYTQSEIAKELGISQAQISRIEKSAINNIKKLIK